MKKLIFILLLSNLLFAGNKPVKVFFIEAIEERGKYIYNVKNDTLLYCNYIHQSKRFPSKRAAKRYLNSIIWNHKRYSTTKGLYFRIRFVEYIQQRNSNDN